MYILTIGETEREIHWMCFDSLEAGRQFLSLLPGYGCELNEETRDYISTRENTFKVVKSILAERGIETERAFHGSEDGEAILYKRPEETDWHFLGHMDPAFVELGKESEERIREWVEESLL